MENTAKPTKGLFSRKPRRDMLALSPTINTLLNILMVISCILALFPIYVIFISSITSEASLTENGYRLWPKEFSTMAYTFLFSEGSIMMTAYKNTILSTLAGTVLTVFMVGLYAYPLSRDNFKLKGFFTFYAFFTMLFGGDTLRVISSLSRM